MQGIFTKFGIKIDAQNNAVIVFAIINSLIGVSISVLLRYQGQKYAEIENEDLCKRFYAKKVKETKIFISMNVWQLINFIKDLIIKGVATAFSIWGIIYISIEGSKNPIQILITLVTLVLFACFGLIGMNSSYCRFYNEQIPYMENKLKEKEINENGSL